MEPRKFPPSLAFRIAGWKQDKVAFNTLVKRGYYPCAPQPVRRGTRWFTERDIVALAIFNVLLPYGVAPDSGLPAWVAGSWACFIHAELHRHPDMAFCQFGHDADGNPFIQWDDNGPLPHHGVVCTSINVAVIREHVSAELAKASNDFIERLAEVDELQAIADKL